MSPEGDRDHVAVQIALSYADYKALYRYIAGGPQQSIFRRYRYLCQALGMAVAFPVVFTASDMSVYVAATAAIVLMVVSRRIAKARFEVARASFDCDLVADHRGVTTTRPGTTTHTRWEALEELLVTDTYLFGRATAISGYVIPRRSLRDAGDVDRLIGWRLAAKAAAVENRPPPPPRYQPAQ